jgi:hypothetical protein
MYTVITWIIKCICFLLKNGFPSLWIERQEFTQTHPYTYTHTHTHTEFRSQWIVYRYAKRSASRESTEYTKKYRVSYANHPYLTLMYRWQHCKHFSNAWQLLLRIMWMWSYIQGHFALCVCACTRGLRTISLPIHIYVMSIIITQRGLVYI